MRSVSSRALVLLAAFGTATTAPSVLAAEMLVDPPATSVPAGLSEKAVNKAIRLGAADTTAIKIRYLDSSNLDYEVRNGRARIHGNYLKWTNNLVRDISVQLQSAELEMGRSDGQ